MKTKLDDFLDWFIFEDGKYSFLFGGMILFGFGIKIGIGVVGSIAYFYLLRK